MSAASPVRNRITQAEERIAALDREAQRLKTEAAAANQQLESFRRPARTARHLSLSRRRSALTALDARNQRDRARSWKSKRAAEDRRQAPSGFAARRVCQRSWARRVRWKLSSPSMATPPNRCAGCSQSGAHEGGHAPAGVLADFLEVEDRYEHVVEDFLRDELNYIVVKSWDAADEGLRLLRSDVDGRATFLVHPEDSQAKFSFVSDEVDATTVAHGDSVVPLKNCIRVLDGFGKSLEVILPKLGNGYIVPDPSVGRDLALENPDAFFLSQSGECFHNVTVTGGKQRSEGPLSMKRELRDVLQQMGELEAAMRDEGAAGRGRSDARSASSAGCCSGWKTRSAKPSARP